METKKEFIYKNLNPEEKKIFNEFEDPIYEFLNDLYQKELLNLEIKEEDARRFLSYKQSLDSLIEFYNDLMDNKKIFK